MKITILEKNADRFLMASRGCCVAIVERDKFLSRFMHGTQTKALKWHTVMLPRTVKGRRH